MASFRGIYSHEPRIDFGRENSNLFFLHTPIIHSQILFEVNDLNIGQFSVLLAIRELMQK